MNNHAQYIQINTEFLDKTGIIGVNTKLPDDTTIVISKIHNKPQWHIFAFRDYPYSTMPFFEMVHIYLNHDFDYLKKDQEIAKHRNWATDHNGALRHYHKLYADALEFAINYFDKTE